ncbi:hypothetical protein [Burkholderia territorii]|nr:hypothetical protein [Burkholderia territorii]
MLWIRTVSVPAQAESAGLSGIRRESMAAECADVVDVAAMNFCGRPVVDIPRSEPLGTLCISPVSAAACERRAMRGVDNLPPDEEKSCAPER